MNILITGCKGYIGTVLTEYLIKKNYNIRGIDSSYYENCLLDKEEVNFDFIQKDIRELNVSDISNIDTIIHLAALSNDPLGEFNPSLTNDINYFSTIKLAQMSKEVGIRRLIYISSQSMYGISDTLNELDEDNSIKNPVTRYASTKWEAEKKLKEINNDDYDLVCLRPSTVFGVSPRLRCDIVFNNLVACAYVTGKIEIKTDGTPWRPVVHVLDLCSAIEASLLAPKSIVHKQSYNVGIKNGNYQVKQLAEAAKAVVPGSEIEFTGEHSKDPRSYKVSFSKIFDHLGSYYKPNWDLQKGGAELVKFFKKIKFNEDDFRGSRCNRLNHLKMLINKKIIDKDLRYI